MITSNMRRKMMVMAAGMNALTAAMVSHFNAPTTQPYGPDGLVVDGRRVKLTYSTADTKVTTAVNGRTFLGRFWQGRYNKRRRLKPQSYMRATKGLTGGGYKGSKGAKRASRLGGNPAAHGW